MIEPSPHKLRTPLISLGCAKGSKHGGESLAGEIRAGAPLKPAARDLKPDADNDICGQLHVLYGQSSLGNRLGKVRLEMFANASERSRDLGASDHKPSPEGHREAPHPVGSFIF